MNFGQWDEAVHTLPDQKKRMDSAKKAGMTPLQIDRDALSGVFAGSGKLPYQTSLSSCTCSDFVRRKLPCKHIYRLAIDLGLTDEAADNGMNRFTFSDTLDSLSVEAKKLLYGMARTTTSDGESYPVLLARSPATDELVLKSLCIESVGDYTKAIGTAPDDFRAAIDDASFCFPPELLASGCRVKKMLAELQRIYEREPSRVEEAFVVLEVSLQVAENVHTIQRRFSKLFTEDF